MKKLLILLWLIPTLSLAEEFKLLCEGEQLLTKSNSDVFRIKKSIVVKVRKASIRAEDETYYNGKSARFEGSYIKDKDSISAMTLYTEAPSKSSCSVVGHDLSINLIDKTLYITKLVPFATKASNASNASNIFFLHLPVKSIFVKYPFFLHSFVSLLVIYTVSSIRLIDKS